jgi:hypothetical protein
MRCHLGYGSGFDSENFLGGLDILTPLWFWFCISGFGSGLGPVPDF